MTDCTIEYQILDFHDTLCAVSTSIVSCVFSGAGAAGGTTGGSIGSVSTVASAILSLSAGKVSCNAPPSSSRNRSLATTHANSLVLPKRVLILRCEPVDECTRMAIGVPPGIDHAGKH